MKLRLLFAVFLFSITLFLGFFASNVFAAPAMPPGQTLGVGKVYNQEPANVVNSYEQYDTNGGLESNITLGNYYTGLLNTAALGITGANGSNGQVLVPGALNFFASGIAYMASVPPVSGRDYVSYMASRLAVPGVAPAYAASGPGGVGFSSLKPILPMWTVFRNMAYVGFAVIFIVIGLMIVLRVKIDPKTTATIQSALPKIVFALILVTFSYAIAGFLVDIMYVSISLMLTVLRAAAPDSGFAETFETNLLSGQTIFHFFLSGGISMSGDAFSAVNNIVTQFLQPYIGGGGSQLLGALGGGLAFLIVAIAILWALFKTWLLLLSAYVHIILGVVFAPLQLMLDAVPGQNQFGAWVRRLLSYILAFPLVIALMFIGLALSHGGGTAVITPTEGFVPPLIGGNNQQSIQALLGIGILLTIPKAVEILQEALKVQKWKWGDAWQDAAKFGVNPFGATTKAYGGLYSRYFGAADLASQEWKTGWAKYYAGLGPQPTPLPARIAGRAALLPFIPKPKCLSVGTLIGTPSGQVAVEKLEPRMEVWSVDRTGNKVAVPVAQMFNTKVEAGHKILHLGLADQRELYVSPGHPDLTGRDIASLQVGDEYNGAKVAVFDLIDYKEERVFDILPDGETGNYWANGILIGSTLKKR